MRRIAFLMILAVLISLVPVSVADTAIYQAPKQVTVSFTGDCTLGTDDRERTTKTGFDAYIKQYGYG